MIVSHRHKLIFLKPRKVAGTSFEIALSKYLTGEDIITPVSRDDEAMRRRLGFTGAHNFNFALVERFAKRPNLPHRLFGYRVPLKFYNHMSANLVRSRIDSAVWRDYRKVSLVRNPWERAISLFFWKGGSATRPPNLADFTTFFEKNRVLIDINYRNYMIGGENVIDHFIRYENFEEDILKLESEIPTLSGLWDTFKSINAKGAARDRSRTRQEIFHDNPKVAAMIAELNAWEIGRFGYSL